MENISGIKKIIEKFETAHEYLEFGYINDLIYPLQKLNDKDWEALKNEMYDWTNLQRKILADAVLEIGNNTMSNFDTAEIYAEIFILSDQLQAEYLLCHFSFLDNDIPKNIETIHKTELRLQELELMRLNINIDFKEKYNLINKLYANVLV